VNGLDLIQRELSGRFKVSQATEPEGFEDALKRKKFLLGLTTKLLTLVMMKSSGASKNQFRRTYSSAESFQGSNPALKRCKLLVI